MSEPAATSKISEIDATELVPGDIILLEAGNSVPADCRLLEEVNLQVQEAVLTGESEPVSKVDMTLKDENAQVGDRKNMVFMGTIVTYGRAEAIVVETGMQSELGKIAEMIQSIDQEQTPLQRRIDQLGKSLAVAALVIVAIVFGLGVLRGESVRLMFQTGISMAVAAVPEGLPAVVYHRSSTGRAAHAQTPVPDPQAAGRGNPRLSDRDLLRQDRHVDRKTA